MSGAVPSNPVEARASHLETLFWRRLLVSGIRYIPRWLQQASLPAWASFFYAQVPHIRRALLANLDHLARNASAEDVPRERWRQELVAFRTFLHYCDSVARAYRFYASRDYSGQSRSSDERLSAAVGAGGVILATGHIGCWQQGAALLRHDGFPAVTLVMAEEPNGATQQLEDQLRDDKLSVVYPARSPLSLLSLRAVLTRGELVAMQLDRPVSSGITLPFLGGQATFAAGPALLSRSCEVPVFPVFFPVRDGEIVVEIEAPLTCERTADRNADLRRFTARLVEVYSRQVLANVDQWYNFFAFWHELDGGSGAFASRRGLARPSASPVDS